jgi:NAD-dependent dihydropyrimidine dehydrogenase PreA subunit
MAYVITEQCVDELDGSCFDACPVDGIYESLRKRYTRLDECIDCGACPPDAILSLEVQVWGADNAAFFTEALTGRGTPLALRHRGRPARPAAADTPLLAGRARA